MAHGSGTIQAPPTASAVGPELSLILLQAIEMLTDFLLENTEEVFEEIPEIDDVRSLLQDVVSY